MGSLLMKNAVSSELDTVFPVKVTYSFFLKNRDPYILFKSSLGRTRSKCTYVPDTVHK